MDQAFFLRAKRLLEQRHPPRLDHRGLVDMLAAQLEASPTARAARRFPAAVLPDQPQAIAALILAEEGWQRAVESQAGCFNRAAAVRRVNTP
ncbi:MAG TPA: hypothetical protein VGB54_09920 [Allosphingosinicella sp.]